MLSRLPAKCKECGIRFTPEERAKGNPLHPSCIGTYADKRQRSAIRKAAAAAKKAARAERQADKAKAKSLKTIPDLIKEAQREFNGFIRARDAGKPCICCGKPLVSPDSDGPGGSFDCGHYRSTGSAPHLRFTESNAAGQRKLCNRWGAGRAVDYRIGLVARIGVAAVEALESDNRIHKWTREELIAIRDTYKAKRKALEQ